MNKMITEFHLEVCQFDAILGMLLKTSTKTKINAIYGLKLLRGL